MKLVNELKTFFLSDVFRSLMLCLVVGLLGVNFADRRRGIDEINGHLNQFQISRLMLNSRAQIQIILVKAALEGRKLNVEEVDTIGRLWESSEYNRAFETTEAEN